MKMKKFLAVVLAVVMIATVFAACGKNKEKKPTVVIGYTIYEPMNYRDENGNLVGFDTELAKAVFEKYYFDTNVED